ncbi:ATP-dependent DNA helicase RecQ [Arthrobacter sp. ISL-48]|uniref:RecQ family ATP-dependent DNA helicase n=1 Tax=Arthrobacter sp. ISL-48 TaxID=2819110 RepID=UPI001BEBC5ED|nr:RecQ family ATP-dependent DNA helicase [Arthrobacter sp. ISL-48]MBT2533041.1 ATP-dependent DNA helicase RecQ [Arthrobacter sp. ISL-48]
MSESPAVASDAASSVDALSALAASAFSLPQLRDGQLAGMAALAGGRDVLAVMPTGYGKSAIYQVAAVHLHRSGTERSGTERSDTGLSGTNLSRTNAAGPRKPGPAVVVSPLIALLEDQLDGLAEELGPAAAVAINSSHSDAEVEDAWQAVEDGSATFLFLAPEQLAKQDTVERIAALDVALFVVDEAHCVSSWGHDFRPDYLSLGTARERLGNPPVAALTATASLPVREEIAERLGMKDPLVLVHGFDRPQISLAVVRHQEDKAKRRTVVEHVTEPASAGPAAGSTTGKSHGLLYAATRKDTEMYAAKLAKTGLRTEAYHAGRAGADRERIHEQFMDDDLDVVVATTAFGMGIDKPNVRFVVHADVPESLDAYYQEIGRSGRDGQPAAAVLHYRAEDLGLRKFFGTHTTDEESLLALLKILHAADGPVPKTSLAELTGFPARRVTGLLNQLQEAGAVKTGKRGVRLTSKAKLPTLVSRAVELAEARQRVDQSRINMMRGYAETDGCRRQFLLGYFGENLQQPCGNCDSCADSASLDSGGPTAGKNDDGGPATAAAAEPFPLQSAVVHNEWGPGLVMRHEDDVITVLFEQEGYKTLSRTAVLEHGLLKLA